MRLSLRELSVSFPDPVGDTLAALGPISFDVAEEEFVCVVGPTGCGKSSLIRVLAGLLPPTSGSALYGDEAIAGPMGHFAIMFQDAHLMPWRTVLDNIALPLEIAGLPRDLRHDKVRTLLSQLHLEQFELAFPAELSGGMAQRVALGRVIVQQPRVLLLDEPFGALDALTRERLSLELLRLRQRFVQTIVMVTHDISEAVFLADRVIVLSRRPGRLVAEISIDLPRPRSPAMIYEQQFLQLTKQVRAGIEDLSA